MWFCSDPRHFSNVKMYKSYQICQLFLVCFFTVDVLSRKTSIIVFVLINMYIVKFLFFKMFSKKCHLIFEVLKDQPIELYLA